MSDPSGHLQSVVGPTYPIERELGRGGMATVYLARDLRHDRRVALKVLRADLAAALGPERFEQEIRLARPIAAPEHTDRSRFGRLRKRLVVHDALCGGGAA